jgi:hypothetical protein
MEVHCMSITKTVLLVPSHGITAVWCQNCTKHTCGENAEFLKLKLVVHIVTTVLYRCQEGALTCDACVLSRYVPCAMFHKNRGIAQAVSRRLPTAAARVRAQVRSCGICGEQNGTRAGFL